MCNTLRPANKWDCDSTAFSGVMKPHNYYNFIKLLLFPVIPLFPAFQVLLTR
jgi:hypothetical protein